MEQSHITKNKVAKVLPRCDRTPNTDHGMAYTESHMHFFGWKMYRRLLDAVPFSGTSPLSEHTTAKHLLKADGEVQGCCSHGTARCACMSTCSVDI